MILSVGMLLDTLGIRHNRPELLEASKRIDKAVDAQLKEKGVAHRTLVAHWGPMHLVPE